MNSGRMLVAAVAATLTFSVPATAHATVAASVTGDGGTPVALAPGSPLPIRNMDVRAYVHVDAGDAPYYTWQVTDPAGTPATSLSTCDSSATSPDDNRLVTYRGNGAYTLTLNLFTNSACTAQQTNAIYAWNVGASVSIGQPASALLIRQPNSVTTITQLLDFAGTPGAGTYEIKYAKDGAVAADGSITGLAVEDGFHDPQTGKVQIIGARDPGNYLVVARAKIGEFATPWSAPVSMKLLLPFDVLSGGFSDRRGPSYQMRTVMRDGSAAGSRVTVAIAKGKTGKRFRTVGSGKVSSKGVFKVRYTVRKLGWYRVRYSFKGNSRVAAGTAYAQVRFRRVIF